MEIKVYTPQLQLLGIVENYSSLLWNRKYSTAGNFELHVPITDDSLRYLQIGNIITYPNAVEAGVIESFVARQDTKKNEITVKGRFLESYLDRRLVYNTNNSPTYNFSGLTEIGMRTLIQRVQDTTPIPLLEVESTPKGYTETVTFQATYQNLMKYESKLADSASFGFRCKPDFINKKITFEVYKGLDHSESNTERVRVVFSDQYANLNQATYMENDQLLKTVCYVGGQGEGANRTWVITGDNSLTGLARREVRLDATDVSPDGLSSMDYQNKLRQRGNDLLNSKDILIRSFECDTVPNGNFIYKEHYDLGDIVTVKKERWGLSIDLRIPEITETYENGKVTIVPTFGNPLPDTIDWEDK